MSRSLIGILTLCIGQAALANDCNQFHDPRYVYQAEIVRVYDGDTVFMDIDLGFRIVLHNEPSRLWGVDTPEVRGEEKERRIEVRDLVREWLPEGSETIIRVRRHMTLTFASKTDPTGEGQWTFRKCKKRFRSGNGSWQARAMSRSLIGILTLCNQGHDRDHA